MTDQNPSIKPVFAHEGLKEQRSMNGVYMFVIKDVIRIANSSGIVGVIDLKQISQIISFLTAYQGSQIGGIE